jgi:hypothetical protein
MAVMGAHPVDELDALTSAQREWARHSERLWQRAHALATEAPAVDPGDVYHALRCLELAPAERLKQGLSRGRLRTHAR